MSLRKLFGKDSIEEEIKDEIIPERIKGKIIHLDKKGYGFITSQEIKFTRIFFHWSGLNQDTLHFTELNKGMEVEFTPKEFSDLGWRAIKIDVLDNKND
jgi:cold shock CspA family protein